ncbi:MAG: hypothetical protein KAR19_00510 [Bacteroidales bacterium]|nr:hypothetical protein [Bacteroidales bacterium]
MKNIKRIWKITIIAVFIISILVFTPLVIPKGVYTPELFGMPYTLWVGMVVYFSFLILILIGVSVHSKIFKEEEDD